MRAAPDVDRNTVMLVMPVALGSLQSRDEVEGEFIQVDTDMGTHPH